MNFPARRIFPQNKKILFSATSIYHKKLTSSQCQESIGTCRYARTGATHQRTLAPGSRVGAMENTVGHSLRPTTTAKIEQETDKVSHMERNANAKTMSFVGW